MAHTPSAAPPHTHISTHRQTHAQFQIQHKPTTTCEQQRKSHKNPHKFTPSAARSESESQKRDKESGGTAREQSNTCTHTSKTPTSMPKSVSPLCSWGPALGAQMIRDGGQQRPDKERGDRERGRQWSNFTSKCRGA